jgi:ATP-dependent helicase HrpA
LVDHEALSEQWLRRGMIGLFAKIERRELRSQIQFLPQWSSSALWLSDRFGADRLRDLVCDLIARLAFVDTNWTSEQLKPMFRTKVEFEIERLKRMEKIAGAAAEVGRWLPKLAEANHKVRSLLEKSAANVAVSTQTVRDQLNSLFDETNVYQTPWCFVRELPRFLQAVAIRLERLKTVGSNKDMEIHSAVATHWLDYKAQLARLQPPASMLHGLSATGALEEYRWLIEEFRVSLYAQQLGTRVSVSPKRLDKLKQIAMSQTS